MDNDILFSEWLLKELEKREWSQADLARRAGVSRAAISNILNELRQPGPDLCEAIARAFDYPPEIIFRHAGLLPRKSPEEIEMDEWRFVLLNLPKGDRDELMETARHKMARMNESLIEFMNTYDQIPIEERGKVMKDALKLMQDILEEHGGRRTK